MCCFFTIGTALGEVGMVVHTRLSDAFRVYVDPFREATDKNTFGHTDLAYSSILAGLIRSGAALITPRQSQEII